MKTYAIEVTRSARKELRKLEKGEGKLIAKAIYSLASNPRPAGVKKLVGQKAWRLRVSDYRVIYEIYDSKVLVIILKVAHRREVYR